MAPNHGSKAEVYYNGFDISTFLNAVGFTSQVDKADASTFKTGFKKYTVGLRDDALTASGWFDGAADGIDQIMQSGLTTGQNQWVYWIYGRALGAIGYAMSATETKYEIKTEMGATASVAMEAVGTYTDRVRSLAADVTVASSANGSSIDFGATALLAPGVLVVHGTTTGSAMTVVLQDSADNTTFADIATASFSGGTGGNPAEQAYRVVGSSNPLRRYVRIRYTGAGTILTAMVGN